MCLCELTDRKRMVTEFVVLVQMLAMIANKIQVCLAHSRSIQVRPRDPQLQLLLRHFPPTSLICRALDARTRGVLTTRVLLQVEQVLENEMLLLMDACSMPDKCWVLLFRHPFSCLLRSLCFAVSSLVVFALHLSGLISFACLVDLAPTFF